MARAKRERLTCTSCGWTGLTTRSTVRLALYLGSTLAAAALIALELLGLTQLGDQVWPLAITILVLSIGARLLIRGDRCKACGGPAIYIKRPPQPRDMG